ncbi:hypothetical protein TNCV_2989841 [Trichonephila clavipes]|nr:hypothetical protein TNCV_2989841 [Trichonephila clavipes]
MFCACHISSLQLQIFKRWDLQLKKRVPLTPKSSSDPRRSPHVIGPVIWQANKPSHFDLFTAFQKLIKVSADLNSVIWRSSVMLVQHGAAQRRRNMCCVKKFEQNSFQEDQIYLNIQRTGKMIQSNWAVSKNATLRI